MKPFLKWAGGKARLAARIAAKLPDAPGRLIEPFVGSGAVFLGAAPRPGGYLLGDANPDLVTLYRRLVLERQGFVDEVSSLFTPENNTREAFNRLRAEFNALEPGHRGRAPIFVYLNRHAFNGICRYNRSGGFNVPFGGYDRTSPPVDEMLAFADAAAGAEFVHQDFRQVMARAVPGDVVYCDPPYVPLSLTASFDGYSAGGFSFRDQRDMAALCRELAGRGIPVLVSNHDTPFTREIYEGAEIEALDVRRSVAASAGSRGKAPEVLAMFHVPGSDGQLAHFAARDLARAEQERRASDEAAEAILIEATGGQRAEDVGDVAPAGHDEDLPIAA